ncbi:MAG: DMT family transporter [Pseudomonadota bacterium]
MVSHAPSQPPVSGRIDNLRGLAWTSLAVLAASAMALAVRAIGEDLDSRMIVLIRSALITLVVCLAWPVTPGLRKIRFSRPGLHLSRGLLLAAATHLAFYALTALPVATATVLFFTAPIFATGLAALTQGERVGPRRLAAVAAGFIGALVILRPGVAEPNLAMLAALGSAFVYAFALNQSREIAEADGAAAALVSSILIILATTIPLALPVWAWPTEGTIWALMAILVVTGGLRGYADIEAYRHAEAAVLTPFIYTRIVIVGVAGYVLFGERPDAATWAGAAIIVASALFIAAREQAARRVRSPEPAGSDPKPPAM